MANFPQLDTIAKKRRALGITQQTLARQVGISQSLATKIERGLVVPSYDVARRIFNYLDGEQHKEDKKASEIMRKEVIVLHQGDPLSTVVKIAKLKGISQFPVLEGSHIVGSLTTRNIVGQSTKHKVSTCIDLPFPSINEDTPASTVRSILRDSQAVVVISKSRIVGIITAEDML